MKTFGLELNLAGGARGPSDGQSVLILFTIGSSLSGVFKAYLIFDANLFLLRVFPSSVGVDLLKAESHRQDLEIRKC